MPRDTARARATEQTRIRILDVARELLGREPDAGMGDVAAAAGVVRRTVYAHFPARSDLVRALAERAAHEVAEALAEVDDDLVPADAVWARFASHVWPLAHRYRVLLALRRGEQGDEIHAQLGLVDRALARLVERGQAEGSFGRHLPPVAMGQVAYSMLFAIADDRRTEQALDTHAATITSLLVLGVPAARARELVDGAPPDRIP